MVKKSTKPKISSGNLVQLSSTMFNSLVKLLDDMVIAGKSSLIPAYSSSMIVTNFLWKAGIIDQECKDKIYVLGDIMKAGAVVGVVEQIFGATSPFLPQLRTEVTQTTNAEGGISTIEKTSSAAAALGGLAIKAAEVAALG